MPRAPRETPGRRARYERYLPFGEGDRLRQVWPIPDRIDHAGGEVTLFPTTDPDHATGRGLISVLRERYARRRGAEQELAEAVAVAGFRAFGSGRPAAVVLVVGADPRDASDQSPAAVRAYLAALGVPLRVWSLAGEEAAGAWGPAVDVSSYRLLEEAVRALRRDLARQRLVWLSGVALPQDVRFADCACCRPAAAC
jgi:hypothetical protein